LNNETVTRKIVIDRQAIQDAFNAQNKCGEYLGVEFAKSQEDIDTIINTVFFVFLALFLKDSLEYAPGRKNSKNGP
jgi:hypothetical protein